VKQTHKCLLTYQNLVQCCNKFKCGAPLAYAGKVTQQPARDLACTSDPCRSKTCT
jgi:hypothetical protein